MLNSTDLENIQRCLGNLLREIVIILEREQIDYWIDFGTLLGAYRNKGFIPWDDDIDIAIPIGRVNDLARLISSELGDLVRVIRPNKTFPSVVCMQLELLGVRGTSLSFASKGISPKFKNYVSIDFFGIEKMGPLQMNPLIRLGRRCLSRLWLTKQVGAFISLDYAKKRLFCGPWLIFLLDAIPYRFVDAITKARGHNSSDRAKHLSHLIQSQFSNLIFPTKEIYPLTKIEFEGELYSAPNDPEKHLRRLYGSDFMVLPPVNNRVQHFETITLEPGSPWSDFFSH